MNLADGKNWIEKSILEGRGSPLPVLSNISSFLTNYFIDHKIPVNWCGFYTVNKNRKALILTTFSLGKPACVRLNLDTSITKTFGVCAAGIFEQKTVYVADVHCREGHIACDAASKSELVVPIFDEAEQAVAVLDIDSPVLNGFEDEKLKADIENLMQHISENADDIDWKSFRNTLL